MITPETQAKLSTETKSETHIKPEKPEIQSEKKPVTENQLEKRPGTEPESKPETPIYSKSR